ncbi:MAG TPA: hypothetical protein VE287_11535, partial [Actinopolymorphaceae bacterium]|nr:hypothetical protein [Actinopolymorphaceae bacterium]
SELGTGGESPDRTGRASDSVLPPPPRGRTAAVLVLSGAIVVLLLGAGVRGLRRRASRAGA